MKIDFVWITYECEWMAMIDPEVTYWDEDGYLWPLTSATDGP